jgi:hypothetical protein
MKFFWLAFINSIGGSLTSLSPTPLNLRARRLGLKKEIPDNDSIDRIIESYNIGVLKGTLKSTKDPYTTMYIVLCQIASGKSDSTDNTPCKDYIVGDEKVGRAREVLGELLERARLVGEHERRRQKKVVAERRVGGATIDRGVDGSVASEHGDAGSAGKSGGDGSLDGQGGFSDDQSDSDDDISTDGSANEVESIHSANSSDFGLAGDTEALIMGIDRRSSGSVRSNAAERGSQEFSDEEGFEGSGESSHGGSGGDDDSSGSTGAGVSASSRRVAQVGGVGPAAAARARVSGHSPSDV